MTAVPHQVLEHDLLAFDAEGEPVLIVEAKRRPNMADDAKRQLERYAVAAGIPYGLVVDPESIEIFELAGPSTRSLLKIPTEELLTAYAHGLEANKVTKHYLVLLIDTWLRNIMQPLESGLPPAYDRLAELGLVDRFHDGRAEVEWRELF